MDALLKRHLELTGIETVFSNEVQRKRSQKNIWEMLIYTLNQVFSIAAVSINSKEQQNNTINSKFR